MYLAAIIRKRFPSQYAIKIIDMNLDCLSVDDLRKEIKEFRPDIIGCSVLSCENDCMNELATAAKDIDGGGYVYCRRTACDNVLLRCPQKS
jgi:hypothetical protein